MFRRVGVNQCPTTAAPITSVTSLYLCPSHANSTGHELPRRSASFIAITCVCGKIDLVLQNARRPQNSQQIDMLRLAQANQQLRRSLRLPVQTHPPVPTSATARSQISPPLTPIAVLLSA